MRAARVTAWNTPPSIVEIADPDTAPGRSVVRVEAATVAHLDRTIWRGDFLDPPARPYTPGVEGAGTIVASNAWDPGTRVFVRGGGLGVAADGTWAELVSAPDSAIGPLPDAVPFRLGAAFFSPCASAWVALEDIARPASHETVLVTGATGSVGASAVQLALYRGNPVVATVSSDTGTDTLPAEVTPYVVGSGAAPPSSDVVIDTVGGAVLEDVLQGVRPGGRVVLIGYVAGTDVSLRLPEVIQRDVALLPLNMIRREQQGWAAVDQLLARVEDGRLTVETTLFALDDVGDALEWLGTRGHRGRAVLEIGR